MARKRHPRRPEKRAAETVKDLAELCQSCNNFARRFRKLKPDEDYADCRLCCPNSIRKSSIRFREPGCSVSRPGSSCDRPTFATAPQNLIYRNSVWIRTAFRL